MDPKIDCTFKTFDEYQEEVRRTKKKHETMTNALCDYSMGLSGEAGEVIELIKKALWQGKQMSIDELKKELGDVMWYIAALADEANLSLSSIINLNVHKLRERYPNGYSNEHSNSRKEWNG